jgi:hypothetical protein
VSGALGVAGRNAAAPQRPVTAPPSGTTGVVDVTVKTLETSAVTRKDHYRYKR